MVWLLTKCWISLNRRGVLMGTALEFICGANSVYHSSVMAAISLALGVSARDCGRVTFGARVDFNAARASLASATIPTSTGQLLPISWGSTSIWISFVVGES